MDLEARTERIAAKKHELTLSLDEHVGALERLHTETSFDFDIATDIHPELIDNTTAAGKERLQFWQNLYSKLDEGVPYTAFVRKSIGLAPGCYGFGAPEEWVIRAFWIRVYKDLPADAIVFSRDEHGQATVHINHPSELIQLTEEGKSVSTEDTTTLFTTAPQPRALFRPPNELYYPPEVHFGQEPIDLYDAAYDSSSGLSAYPFNYGLLDYTSRQERIAEKSQRQ